MEHHWTVFEATRRKAEAGTRAQLNVFLERNAIRTFARRLDYEVVRFHDASQGPFVPLSRPVVHENGTRVEGRANMGQSVCVLRRPESPAAPA